MTNDWEQNKQRLVMHDTGRDLDPVAGGRCGRASGLHSLR